MPDYKLDEPNAVRMIIYGGVVDLAYSRMLMQKTDLPLTDILALDRVQKKLPLPEEAAQRLRRAKLIEGRKPNFHVSAVVADLTDEKANYLKNRGFKASHYKQMIIDYIQKFNSANRKEIDELLFDSLPKILNDEQKKTKINNLIFSLSKKEGLIENSSKSNKRSSWVLKEVIKRENKK